MRYTKAWDERAQKQFEKCIAAHGGWTAWDSLGDINFKLDRFYGGLVFLKGLHRTFFPPNSIKVTPQIRKVEFFYEDHSDIFENGKITHSINKYVVENGRSLFKKTTFEQWHAEHSAYFFGYAWANYLSYPFILPQFDLLNFEIKSNGTSIFTIRFPEDFHTHCRDQQFYFGKDHLLEKHEYHAECAGPLVFGRHYCDGYFTYQGLQIAKFRKVHPRVGCLVLPVYGIYGEISLL